MTTHAHRTGLQADHYGRPCVITPAGHTYILDWDNPGALGTVTQADEAITQARLERAAAHPYDHPVWDSDINALLEARLQLADETTTRDLENAL